jgi:PAS domain S-box-containing protein
MKSRDDDCGGGSDQFSRAVLDGLDQLVFVFDAGGETCWCNESARSIVGQTQEADETPAFGDIVTESDREQAQAAVDRLVDSNELTVQLTVKPATGAERPYEFRGSPFELPSERPAFVAIGYAIADRREREQKLDALRECSLALMGTETKAETAQLAVDAAHTIIEAPLSGIHFPDSAGERLAPVALVETVEEAFGDPPSYPRNAPQGTRAAVVWSVFDEGEPLRIDDVAAYDKLDEGTPTGSVIIHPLGDHGVFIVSAAEADAFDDTDSALVDILAGALRAALDRVEREGELRRQNDRLDRFTSIVSHDMRNPLATARGYLELAQETGEETHLDRVDDSLVRMETLIDDLLTLARQGDDSLAREDVELAELTEKSWEGVETDGATLEVETTTTVWGDESRLRQLFENLFRNAVEHGPTGRQTGAAGTGGVEPRPGQAEPSPEHAEPGASGEQQPAHDRPAEGLTVTVGDLENGFYVADDGVGIPESERSRVLLSGYSTGEGGTGLGLSIVEEVATAHDWSVSVTESETGGARFEFRSRDAS